MEKKVSTTAEIRSHIKACAKLKKSAMETFEEVHNIYGDQQPSYRTVSRWLKKFKDERESVKDDVRSGRPKTPQRKFNNKVWMTKHGKRPVIAKRCQSTKKILYAIFFDREGVVLQFPIPEKKSVTGKMYKYKILHKLKQQYKKKRPKTGIKGIFLLHDNAPAHKSKLVTDFLSKEGVIVIPHPAYSPDLSPCDFFSIHKT
ncbi:histone-lysine N-methyltransferase SETMAR-like [Saccostrea echinata]|uniref:histone-lysine N-methyltransferase SETMAR-like n=1 Tax=Saccostrea echinata TaxID=191078 RepID=UPI002A7FC82B|nr:histone-lysine N-methyltransferase SETMAR-like [Saccostrea echinata]